MKDTKYTKEAKSLDFMGLSFVPFVSFVFEKINPAKNGNVIFLF